MKMEVYDFGKRETAPKPELKTPWEAMRAYDDLQRSIKNIEQYATIRGRSDHFIRDLDILMNICRDGLFHAMVIREAITGSKTREESEEKERARLAGGA